MTEEEARAWFSMRDVPRETIEQLERYATLLSEENANQNLIAKSTLSLLWSRHLVDSAQLLALAPPQGGWVDLGSGAGLPGIVAAILGRTVTLVEARTKRVSFLRHVVSTLGLNNVEILPTRLEVVPSHPFGVIAARAFAPLTDLLKLAHRFSRPETVWLLPKGRSAASELATVGASWQGDFRMVPSITDPESAIIVASDVRPGKRSR